MEWIDDELCLVNSGEITHVFERSPTNTCVHGYLLILIQNSMDPQRPYQD
jgi:hypothetical protein